MDKSHHGKRPQDQEQPGNMKLSRIPHILNTIHTFFFISTKFVGTQAGITDNDIIIT